MMLTAILLAATTPVVVDDDIVVLARKLQSVKVKANMKRRKGVLLLTKCRVTRGSGDIEIDAIPCTVAQICADAMPATPEVMQACLVEQSQDRIDALVVARRASREGGE